MILRLMWLRRYLPSPACPCSRIVPRALIRLSAWPSMARGDVWVGESGVLDEYDNSGNRLSPSGGWNGVLPGSTFFPYSTLAQLVFDSTGNLWANDNNGYGDLYQISSTDGSILADPFFSAGSALGVYTPDSR